MTGAGDEGTDPDPTDPEAVGLPVADMALYAAGGLCGPEGSWLPLYLHPLTNVAS